MAEPIAVLALRRKRDQISGTIAHYERLPREAQRDLAHINASLRLFGATGEAADQPPYVDLNRVLRRGETTKICMEALAKEARPCRATKARWLWTQSGANRAPFEFPVYQGNNREISAFSGTHSPAWPQNVRISASSRE